MTERGNQAEVQSCRSRERSFWHKFPEKAELNQYWYSKATVDVLAEEVLAQTKDGDRCGFLSTPSVYFAVKAKLKGSRELILLDIDDKFATEGESFIRFDFQQPRDIPARIHHSIDFVLIDPPFITKEVWERYAESSRLLLRPTTGKALLSTIEENEMLLHSLLGCRIQRFKPSIPHLVYQYALFANYDSSFLQAANPEVED
ncbi:hypothetical protein Poli38472_005721 [Pythium oligandrum]|uniref:Uncharacterized protein n=1 Tax=Pythium oligandrum TaxID=41045 RepID=A0A8K1CSR4_PYTOL|nr:hypothetical protein Poli38472_005721 [Pythium oligandrum]|eukprot:TMW68253.1 hypothetical protein Poli38472_005721 [Pythium oligandrum]